MKGDSEVLVSAADKFLTWSEVAEKSKKFHPVMVSCMQGEKSWSYGCIPRVDGEVVFLRNLFLPKKLCSAWDPISMLQVGPLRMSVIEGRFISRVVVRVTGVMSMTGWTGWQFMNDIGQNGHVLLYIDEPVDPSGSRCLFNSGGIWGGARADWVEKHTHPFSSSVVADFVPVVRNKTVGYLNHVGETVVLNCLPKNPHEIRLNRAAGIWQEWDQQNVDEDNR